MCEQVMHTASGGCHCGNILVAIEFAHAPSTYNPRTCDCDFCRKHGAAYLSDAQGSLVIRTKNARESGKYRQGSGKADFLLCRNCGVLVAVFYRSNARLYAAVNATIVDDREKFGIAQPVSPKRLSAAEKAQRWQDIWFSNVSM
jgi:hypothetical protein